ncbi:MAG: hypothetical protein JWR20_2630 [Marmoricola sp.]|nr:hypothetical protein [Marmoricola sp.]
MHESLPPRAPERRDATRPTTAGGRPRAARRVRAAAVLAAATTCSLALAACGTTSTTTTRKPDSQPVSGGTTLASVWPLTGEPVRGSTPDRPVLVTKIDNTERSAPQVGLGRADLITEELVEGGATRLAVFFYQSLPPVAGPVRSIRASDIGITEPAHAVVVSSGAAPSTLARLRAAGVHYYDDEIAPASYYRDTARQIPYNLMVRLPSIAARSRSRAVVPASYLPWGTEKDWPGGPRATGLDAVFSRDHTTSWRFAGGKYVDDRSFAAAGDRFRPDTVIVVRVREGDAGYLDPAGNRVPETLWTGRGPVMVLHRGQVVRGTWTKASRTSPVRFRTAAGPLKIPAGHVWLELVPVDGAGGRVALRR